MRWGEEREIEEERERDIIVGEDRTRRSRLDWRRQKTASTAETSWAARAAGRTQKQKTCKCDAHVDVWKMQETWELKPLSLTQSQICGGFLHCSNYLSPFPSWEPNTPNPPQTASSPSLNPRWPQQAVLGSCLFPPEKQHGEHFYRTWKYLSWNTQMLHCWGLSGRN